MKLARQDKLPTDCVPEEISVFSQDFWAMRRIADNIRWDFANVVVGIGIFEDFARAWWYRVTLEPKIIRQDMKPWDFQPVQPPTDYNAWRRCTECHRAAAILVEARSNGGFAEPMIGNASRVTYDRCVHHMPAVLLDGDRCQWPRYKTLDVPVSYFDYEHGQAERVVNGYDLAGQLRKGGLE